VGGVGFLITADDLFNLSPFLRLRAIVAGCAWWGVRIDFLSVPFDGLVQIG